MQGLQKAGNITLLVVAAIPLWMQLPEPAEFGLIELSERRMETKNLYAFVRFRFARMRKRETVQNRLLKRMPPQPLHHRLRDDDLEIYTVITRAGIGLPMRLRRTEACR